MLIRKIINWLTSLLLIAALLMTINLAVLTKIHGEKKSLLGSQIMVVLSGSMSPTFNTGSVVAVKPVRFEYIKKGDIITFKDVDGRIVTHRVIEIKNHKLVTKGDANDAKDSNMVTPDRVIGKVNFWVPYVGYWINFLRSKMGVLLIFVVPGIYLVLNQMWRLFKIVSSEEFGR